MRATLRQLVAAGVLLGLLGLLFIMPGDGSRCVDCSLPCGTELKGTVLAVAEANPGAGAVGNKPVQIDKYVPLLKINSVFILVITILGFFACYYKKSVVRYLLLLVSLGYLGFYLQGGPCPVGRFIRIPFMPFFEYQQFYWTLLIVAIPLALTFVFGRIYCGHACPLGAVQEFVAIKNRLIKVSPKIENKLKHLRFVFLAIFLAMMFIDYNTLNYCKIDPFKLVFTLGGSTFQIVAGSAIIFTSLILYRPFCRYVCPYSLALEHAARAATYNVEKDSRCTNCDKCTAKCNIAAMRDDGTVDNGLCIRCGECLECQARHMGKRQDDNSSANPGIDPQM